MKVVTIWCLVAFFGSPGLGDNNGLQNFKENLERVFLHEDPEEDTLNPSTGNFSTFCEPKDPICKKFLVMLQNESVNRTSEENESQARLRRNAPNPESYDLNCDLAEPMCQKFHSMLNQENQEGDIPAGRSDGGDMDEHHLDCNQTNPICREFQSMLRQKREGRLLKDPISRRKFRTDAHGRALL